MSDLLYNQQSVPASHRPLFEQLAKSFPNYEIWQRSGNFNRSLSVGVVNRDTGAAAVIDVVNGSHARSHLLSEDEIERIRKHVSFERDEDLVM